MGPAFERLQLIKYPGFISPLTLQGAGYPIGKSCEPGLIDLKAEPWGSCLCPHSTRGFWFSVARQILWSQVIRSKWRKYKQIASSWRQWWRREEMQLKCSEQSKVRSAEKAMWYQEGNG